MPRTLIDKALKKCQGNQAELARHLGVSRAMVTYLVKGERPLTPEIAGLLAEYVGDDIAPHVMEAVLDGMSHTERGQRVKEAMQRAFLAGAVATLGTFATQSAAAKGLTTETDVNSPLTKYASYFVRGLARIRVLFIRTRLPSVHVAMVPAT